MAAGNNGPQDHGDDLVEPADRDNRPAGGAAAVPNLAAAQLPGPGASQLAAGETGSAPPAPEGTEDPDEQQG